MDSTRSDIMLLKPTVLLSLPLTTCLVFSSSLWSFSRSLREARFWLLVIVVPLILFVCPQFSPIPCILICIAVCPFTIFSISANSFLVISLSFAVWTWPISRYVSIVVTANLQLLSVDITTSSPSFILFCRSFRPFLSSLVKFDFCWFLSSHFSSMNLLVILLKFALLMAIPASWISLTGFGRVTLAFSLTSVALFLR